MRTEHLPIAALAGLAMLLAGCGGGTAALVGGGGGSSGGGPTNSAPSVPVLEVPAGLSELSPATIRFTLADPEGNPISVELEYEHPVGTGLKEMTLAGKGELLDLPTSAAGVTHQAVWNFAADLGTTSLTKNVHVVLTATGGQGKVVPGTVLGDVVAAFGNNPALIVATVPSVGPGGEVVGIAKLTFTVADDSGHDVSILPEHRLAGSIDWVPATPAGQLPPSFEAPPLGVTIDFFWDVLADLGSTEHDVEFRFTANDGFTLPTGPLVPGAPAAIRVDNNLAPFVALGAESFVTNPDSRRGIPIPFTVTDAEGDEVDVVFQWRRQGESFPALPSDPDAIRAALTDPEQRLALRIAAEFPARIAGRVVPVDEDTVRLPELSKQASPVLRTAIAEATGLGVSQALQGARLEVLRPFLRPRPQAAGWPDNPLRGPVCALPIGDGLTALVLDQPLASQWRLSEVELATGVVTREIATVATGTSSAMAWESDERSVLVADHLSGLLWQVHRVDLATGAVVAVAGVQDGPVEIGIVRDLVSLGSGAALATVGGSVVHLDVADPLAPRVATVVSGLHQPWGLQLDPSSRDRVYVAEHDAQTATGTGQVVVVDLGTREVRALLSAEAGTCLPRAQAMALSPSRATLYVVTDEDAFDATLELRGVSLGQDVEPFVLADDLPAGVASLKTGPDGLIVFSVEPSDDLLVGGGLEQRRTIAGYDAVTREVSVQEPFAPALRPLQPWRIVRPGARGTPSGADWAFVWDSRDAQGDGEIFVRGTVLDTDVGTSEETDILKQVRTPLDDAFVVTLGEALPSSGLNDLAAGDLEGDGDVDLVVLANPFFTPAKAVFFRNVGLGVLAPDAFELPLPPNALSLAVGDLDEDGRLDLVTAHPDLVLHGQDDTLNVFFQTSAGTFDLLPLVLDGPSIDDPVDVAVADVDADGDLDIVSANFGSCAIHFQSDGGVFESAPIELEIAGSSRGVTTADLDGNGFLDVVSSDIGQNGAMVTIYHQAAPGEFARDPLVLELGFPFGNDSVPIAADFDGDGSPDLAISYSSSGFVLVFLQESGGTFPDAPIELQIMGAPDVEAADVDGDGGLDVLSTRFFEHAVVVFHQIGPGAFEASPTSMGDATVSFSPVALQTADLDGDGALEVISANRAFGDISVFSPRTPGAFDAEPLVLPTPSATALEAGDMDGDGDLDLVAASLVHDNFAQSYAAAFVIHEQTSPGVFDPAPKKVSMPTAVPALDIFTIEVADLDGDGALDLLAGGGASGGAGFVAPISQTGPGVFDPEPRILQPAGLPLSLAAADLDQDGDVDLVSLDALAVPLEDPHVLSIFFQGPTGGFGALPMVLGAPAYEYLVETADLDGDGDEDLVTPGDLGFDLFFQEDTGVFSEPVLVQAEDSLFLSSVADVDGDGDLDLIGGDIGGESRVFVFFQGQPGTFDAPPLPIAIDGALLSIGAGDLDSDGDVDLATWLQSDFYRLALHLQTSPGVFDEAETLDTGFVFGALTGDFDADGDLDLAGVGGGGFEGYDVLVFHNDH